MEKMFTSFLRTGKSRHFSAAAIGRRTETNDSILGISIFGQNAFAALSLLMQYAPIVMRHVLGTASGSADDAQLTSDSGPSNL
jgi:hypothetical protein